MNMTELKNYLTEKNISLKDFAKITKVKEKKLTRVLDNQAFFSDDEATRVSSFLGVSKNELYHGVIERKGELPEVTEQNNLNHFIYYLKNRFKTKKNIHRFLEALLGFFGGLLLVFYVVVMFIGVSGLPTILRSFDVMFFCLIMPLIGISMVQDFAFEKTYKKKSIKENNLKKESLAFSAIVLLFGIVSFVNEFIPVTVLIFLIVSAISQVLLSFASVFKNKPYINGFARFGLYAIPIIFMLAASGFLEDFLNKNVPDDIMSSSSSAVAMVFVGLMLFWLIFASFVFALKQADNVFVEGTGNLVSPMKKEKTITKKRMTVSTVIYSLFACLIFLGICASQGLYLKYIYMSMLEGKEDTVNWTADFVTDFESQYKKGEYDVVKFEGMKIKIPKDYSFDKKTDYTTIYKKGEDNFIMLQKPMYEQPLDFDLFDEDFGEGKITEKQKEELKSDYIKYFGVYPKNMYEWHKLNGSVTLDDIDIFNPRKTALLSTTLIMKSVAAVPDSQYYLYENGDLYANIIIHTIENEEKGDREMVSVSFGSPNLEYSFTLARPDQDNDKTIEEVTKILNSVKMN
jgi:plasmid maintenance system antidote protein VapI